MTTESVLVALAFFAVAGLLVVVAYLAGVHHGELMHRGPERDFEESGPLG